MAAQTLVDEKYANNASTAITVAPAGTVTYDEVRKLAETTGKISRACLKIKYCTKHIF